MCIHVSFKLFSLDKATWNQLCAHLFEGFLTWTGVLGICLTAPRELFMGLALFLSPWSVSFEVHLPRCHPIWWHPVAQQIISHSHIFTLGTNRLAYIIRFVSKWGELCNSLHCQAVWQLFHFDSVKRLWQAWLRQDEMQLDILNWQLHGYKLKCLMFSIIISLFFIFLYILSLSK